MISRRTFLRNGLGAAALASGLEPRGWALPAEEDAASSPLTIDTLATDGPGFDPRAALAAGISAAVLDLRLYPRNFMAAIDALADWNDAFRRPDSGFHKVLRAADLAEARRQNRFGVILACQDAAILDSSTGSVNDRNLRNLRFFYDLGLRVLQLTHNDRNALGDGMQERNDGGLSLLGEKVVAEMNALGMLVDLSHCSDRTTLDALRLSSRPCAVTHAGCRALHPTRRNKTDEQIRALAGKGGYFGIYNMSLWLTERETTSVEDVVDHIGHLVKVGGIDLPGFGSDHPMLGDATPQNEKVEGMTGYVRRNFGLGGAEAYPKHVTVTELDGPDRLRVLAAALTRRGYKTGEVEKILGGNFARVFREVCG